MKKSWTILAVLAVIALVFCSAGVAITVTNGSAKTTIPFPAPGDSVDVTFTLGGASFSGTSIPVTVLTNEKIAFDELTVTGEGFNTVQLGGKAVALGTTYYDTGLQPMTIYVDVNDSDAWLQITGTVSGGPTSAGNLDEVAATIYVSKTDKIYGEITPIITGTIGGEDISDVDVTVKEYVPTYKAGGSSSGYSEPTENPTEVPTENPTEVPTDVPTEVPTFTPATPVATPTVPPTTAAPSPFPVAGLLIGLGAAAVLLSRR